MNRYSRLFGDRGHHEIVVPHTLMLSQVSQLSQVRGMFSAVGGANYGVSHHHARRRGDTLTGPNAVAAAVDGASRRNGKRVAEFQHPHPNDTSLPTTMKMPTMTRNPVHHNRLHDRNRCIRAAGHRITAQFGRQHHTTAVTRNGNCFYSTLFGEKNAQISYLLV